MEINQEELDLLAKIVLNDERVNIYELSIEDRKILRDLIKRDVVEFALAYDREEPLAILDKKARNLVYEMIQKAPHSVNQHRHKHLYPRKPIGIRLLDALKGSGSYSLPFLLGLLLGLVLERIFMF